MYDCIVWLMVGAALAGSLLGDFDEATSFEWRSDAMGELGYVAMWAGRF